jgi:hypothetical protein
MCILPIANCVMYHQSLPSPAALLYSFPYCFTEGKVDFGRGAGSQWSINSSDPIHTDAWCRDTTNNIPPTLSLPPHSTPSGLVFYNGIGGWAFPSEYQDSAFIALHGSDDNSRSIPQEAKVIRVRWDDESEKYVSENFLTQTGWAHRPTDVRVGIEGELWVTSDTSGTLFVIRYLNVTVCTIFSPHPLLFSNHLGNANVFFCRVHPIVPLLLVIHLQMITVVKLYRYAHHVLLHLLLLRYVTTVLFPFPHSSQTAHPTCAMIAMVSNTSSNG